VDRTGLQLRELLAVLCGRGIVRPSPSTKIPYLGGLTKLGVVLLRLEELAVGVVHGWGKHASPAPRAL
jgi:hypothetical protein